MRRTEDSTQQYRAYLLRCWVDGGELMGPEDVWRFSLEEIGGRDRRLGFGDFETLMAFLRGDLQRPDDEAAGTDRDGGT